MQSELTDTALRSAVHNLKKFETKPYTDKHLK